MNLDKSLMLNRIKEHYNFTSNAEFARFLDISPQALSNWYSRNTFDYEILYTKCVDVDIDWLFTGKGEMLKKEKESNIYKLKTDYNLENQAIPLYEVDATAGLITLFDNQVMQNPIGELSIPNAPKCDGAVYVRGDSMYPILKSGDIVAYKTIYDPANIFWGEMYLLDIDVEGEQYLTIKYVQRSDKGDNHVYLVSHNGNHQPVHILKSNIRALALVKASIRYNSMG